MGQARLFIAIRFLPPQARESTPAAEHSAEPQRPAASQPGAQVRPRRAPDPLPLSPRRYKLEVTLDEQAHDQLRQLQDLLAHQIRHGDPAVIVKRALELLLADTLKKKTALNKKPQAQNTPRCQPAPRSQSMSTPRGESMSESQQTSRAIPAQLKRQVWERDQGRCGFMGEGGNRCHETRAVEYAHLHPWAKGGGHSLDNLGLRCHAHNAYEAIQDYGAEFMQNKRRMRQPVQRVREPVQRYRVCRVQVGPLLRDKPQPWLTNWELGERREGRPRCRP